MGYELGITEVGPAEYPLIEVLRRTIFDEFGHQSLSTIADDLQGQQNILCLIAHLEGNPVGFKIGHHDRAGVYYSKAGGVLKEYRRLGLASRMHDWQVKYAKAHGYTRIWFNTFNHFKDMVRSACGMDSCRSALNSGSWATSHGNLCLRWIKSGLIPTYHRHLI